MMDGGLFAESRRELLEKQVAYLMRYGHQSLEVLYRLSLGELVTWYMRIGSIIEQENDTSKKT